MPPRGLILWFTGLPSATRTTIASLTAQVLKQRGWNIETLEGEHSPADWISVLKNSKGDEDAFIQHLRRVCASGIHNEAIALVALQSTAPQTPESRVQAFVEVELGIPKYEEVDESRKVVEGDRTSEDLNLTKIVLQPDAEPEQGVADILSKLEGLGLVAGSSLKDSVYDEDDEAMIRSRLEALGYL